MRAACGTSVFILRARSAAPSRARSNTLALLMLSNINRVLAPDATDSSENPLYSMIRCDRSEIWLAVVTADEPSPLMIVFVSLVTTSASAASDTIDPIPTAKAATPPVAARLEADPMPRADPMKLSIAPPFAASPSWSVRPPTCSVRPPTCSCACSVSAVTVSPTSPPSTPSISA